jgi:hypothetical protein
MSGATSIVPVAWVGNGGEDTVRSNKRRSRKNRRNRRGHREAIQHGTARADHPEPIWTSGILTHAGLSFLVNLSTGKLAADISPLYTLLAAIQQTLSNRLAYSIVIASAQFVRALEHMGFEAELVPACTSLVRKGEKRPIDIGVWEHPPVVHPDGTTDGHVVVWADSYKRCIDLGLCHHPEMLKLSSDNDSLTNPIVLPIAGGRAQFFDSGTQHTTLRPPFGIFWTLFPQWNSRLEPFFIRHEDEIERGGLALANVTVDLLSALAVYNDLAELYRLYPRLSNLLSGRVRLPNS